MAIGNYETAEDRGQPAELYLFTYGKNGSVDLTYAYTDSERPITHDTITYSPLPIKRQALKSTGNPDNIEMKIEVPRVSEIAALFQIYPPTRVVTVTLRQGHVANPDDSAAFLAGENFPVIWVGKVLESRRENAKATLGCQSSSAAISRPILQRNYQWACPLDLYGARCAASRAAGTTTGTVQVATGNRITFTDSTWVKAGTNIFDYTGGEVEWAGTSGTERRTILRTSDFVDTVSLDGPILDLAAGDTVTVYLGCPRTLEGCQVLHDNVINYGGHPYIPTGRNPIGRNTHF